MKFETLAVSVSFKLDGRYRKGEKEFSIRQDDENPELWWVPWNCDTPQSKPKSGDTIPNIDFGGLIWFKKDGGMTYLSTYDNATDFKFGKII